MRKSLFLFLFFLSAGLWAQQEFCLKLEVVGGDDNSVVIGVFAQGTDTPYKMGTSNLQFSFDQQALGNPVLEASYLPEEIVVPPIGTFSIYRMPTVTTPRPNEASLNIELVQDGAGEEMIVAPGFFRIADIRFDRLGPPLDMPVSWTYDGGSTGTVMFLDDNTTQIFASNGISCLAGVDADVLPVSYLNFSALPLGKVAVLNWATARETANQGFQVQHSINGRDFTTIGFVEAAGAGADYDFKHIDPVSGINYYRLSQVDIDGTQDISVVRSVNFSGVATEWSVFPNPVKDLLTVSGVIINEGTGLRLYDGKGREVARENGVNQLSVAKLPAGVYVLEVMEGAKISHQRVVVAR